MPPSQDEKRAQAAPIAPASSADTTPEEAEAEMEALCAAYEALVLLEAGECLDGCDYPDGPLSPTGCHWSPRSYRR